MQENSRTEKSNTTWSRQAIALWAKTSKEFPEAEYMTLPEHLMDSAYVAGGLWDTWVSPNLKNGLASDLGFSPAETRDFIRWLAGTHDVGKATKAFQSQLEKRGPEFGNYAQRVRDAGLPLGRAYTKDDWYPHSAASQVIITRYLENAFGDTRAKRAVIRGIAEVSGAHHGLPAFSQKITNAKSDICDRQESAWADVQHELVSTLTHRLKAERILDQLICVGKRITYRVRMIATGIVIMADWIASNVDYFPLVSSPTADIEERFQVGMSRAHLAAPWRPGTFEGEASSSYAARFGWADDRVPFAVQEQVFEVARRMEGPGLLCIEAPMGQGKTEAALMAAEILAQKNGQTGIIFAAPTMATSDSLFKRVRDWAELSGGGQVLSMYLGHSKNQLNREYVQTPKNSATQLFDNTDSKGRSVGTGADAQKRSTAVVDDWMRGRKKGMLSSIVVSTVDQILMLALQSKHAMLRHLGLAGKVVVVDETHAYDAYMTAYMARTLTWLGYYGVPVILLSATLPQAIKGVLLGAYQEGLLRGDRAGDDNSVPPSGSAYPAITVADTGGVSVVDVPAQSREIAYSLEVIPDELDDLRQQMRPVAEAGGCLLVLCNTVSRAQDAYTVAKELVGADARLLHARFISSDRVVAEEELSRELGPDAHAGDGRPRRRIVVATQVVEQSLDVDFDGIISDIAPIDLLLQRLGRVFRHRRDAEERPAWGKVPTLTIRGLNAEFDELHLPVFEESQELIYERAVLLGTCAQLLPYLAERRSLVIPTEIPSLVHAVYDDQSGIPTNWVGDFAQACEEMENRRAAARKKACRFQFSVPFRDGNFTALWDQQNRDVEKNAVSEAQGLAQVRDVDPTLEVIVTQRVPGGYRPLPWVGDGYEDEVLSEGMEVSWNVARDLATSTVRLPYAFSNPKRGLFEDALNELERSTDEGWARTPILSDQLQLLLDENFRATIAGRVVRYDRELGLIDESAEQWRASKKTVSE